MKTVDLKILKSYQQVFKSVNESVSLHVFFFFNANEI